MKYKAKKPPLKRAVAGFAIGLAAVWCGAASSSPPGNQTSGIVDRAAGTMTEAALDSSPEGALVNFVFDSATAEVASAEPDTWFVTIPFLGAGFCVTFEQFAGVLFVETIYANGDPDNIGLGMEYDRVIFWMDITGAIFFGNMNRGAGTASGIVFDYNGASSIWFAEQKRPDSSNLHHLLYGSSFFGPASTPIENAGRPYNCFTCHEVDTSSGVARFVVERDCRVCHGDNVN